MVESEALLQLGHLTGEGRRVCGAAGEDLDCHGTAVAGAEQPIDDLPFAAFAVTAVTELGERTATAFQVARRHVVEHPCAAAERSCGEGPAARRLPPRRGHYSAGSRRPPRARAARHGRKSRSPATAPGGSEAWTRDRGCG